MLVRPLKGVKDGRTKHRRSALRVCITAQLETASLKHYPAIISTRRFMTVFVSPLLRILHTMVSHSFLQCNP